MADEFAKAQLIFLDEIAKRNAEAADALRANPENVRQIIEAAVEALRGSLSAGTSAVVEAIRSAPRPESIVEPLAALQNAVVIQGNRQQDLLRMVAEAVREKDFPVRERDFPAPVRKWKVTPDRNHTTGLIQSVTIEAVD